MEDKNNDTSLHLLHNCAILVNFGILCQLIRNCNCVAYYHLYIRACRLLSRLILIKFIQRKYLCGFISTTSLVLFSELASMRLITINYHIFHWTLNLRQHMPLYARFKLIIESPERVKKENPWRTAPGQFRPARLRWLKR